MLYAEYEPFSARTGLDYWRTEGGEDMVRDKRELRPQRAHGDAATKEKEFGGVAPARRTLIVGRRPRFTCERCPPGTVANTGEQAATQLDSSNHAGLTNLITQGSNESAFGLATHI